MLVLLPLDILDLKRDQRFFFIPPPVEEVDELSGEVTLSLFPSVLSFLLVVEDVDEETERGGEGMVDSGEVAASSSSSPLNSGGGSM